MKTRGQAGKPASRSRPRTEIRLPRLPEKREENEGEIWKEPEERSAEEGRRAFAGSVRKGTETVRGLGERKKGSPGTRRGGDGNRRSLGKRPVRGNVRVRGREITGGARPLPEKRALALARQKAGRSAQSLARAGQGLNRLGQTLAAAARKLKAAVQGLARLLPLLGTPAGFAVLLTVLSGLLLGSAFGIFFSAEAPGEGMTLAGAVREINASYQAAVDAILTENPHTVFRIEGDGAPWKDVLAVYAVRTTTDPKNGQEVVTMNEEKKAQLSDIFWTMTELSFTLADGETDPASGERGRLLTVRVTGKSAGEAADYYGFGPPQKRQVRELMEMDASVWLSALYGVAPSDAWIVQVALTQLGNAGGRPYWSWYGFEERVAWCACFVSWCADQCGYIDLGIVPRFASCAYAVEWFRERGQWADGSMEPLPGMIIFFDWDDPDGEAGPRDGRADHTGIVEKVEDGYVHTVEGNSSDQCRQRKYPLGSPKILGYGMPDYGKRMAGTKKPGA